MPMALGSVVQARWRMSYFGERYMLTQTYVVSSTTSVVTSAAELAALAVTLADVTTPGTPGKELVDLLPDDVGLDYVDTQQITPIRSAYKRQLIGVMGSQISAPTGNVAGIITLRTDFAGRDQIANKHIGPLPGDAYDNGAIEAPYQILLASLGTALLSTVGILTSTVLLDPCIFHRGSGTSSTVTNKIVSDRVGTMRRRTLRVGE